MPHAPGPREMPQTPVDPRVVTQRLGPPDLLRTAGRHSCLLWPDGTLRCTGYGQSGQLGLGDQQSRKTLTPLPELQVRDVSLGPHHSCAVLEDTSIRCFGQNTFGQLGIGLDHFNAVDCSPKEGPDASCVLTPTRVMHEDQTPLWGAKSVATGARHSCALMQNGDVRCWGSNLEGTLGLGGFDPNPHPFVSAAIPHLEAVELVAGSGHTCARTREDRVYCWGRNAFGQLGNTRRLPEASPRPVQGLEQVQALAAGLEHSCALLSDSLGGQVFCFGLNDRGQLGDGSQRGYAATPTPVLRAGSPPRLLEDVDALGSGGKHNCAPPKGWKVFCWGANDFGQLGSGTIDRGRHPVAQPAVVVSQAQALSRGHGHTMFAVSQSGETLAWGSNEMGQASLSSLQSYGVPTAVHSIR